MKFHIKSSLKSNTPISHFLVGQKSYFYALSLPLVILFVITMFPQTSFSWTNVILKSGARYHFEKIELKDGKYIGYNNFGKSITIEFFPSEVKSVNQDTPPLPRPSSPSPAPTISPDGPREFTPVESGLLILGVTILVVTLIPIVAHIVAMKCPKCNSKECKLLEIKEIDRFIGDKKIDIKNSAGTKIDERHVAITFIVERQIYQCSKCQTKFAIDNKKELGV